jgi:outer membrane protein assembly factor BamD (BamD/ComL family)
MDRLTKICFSPWTKRHVAMLILGTSCYSCGCTTLNPFKKEDEVYVRARNAIEGYEDKEGNWVRPEGLRAEKSRDSGVPKALHFIPGLAPKQANKELARSKYLEADDIFKKASSLEGEERQKTFVAAGKKYIEAGKNWESSALEQDALLMAAESYYFAEYYDKAEDLYAKVLKEYPRTRYQDKIDQRMMAIGQYWLQYNDQFYHVNFTDKKRPLNDTPKHGSRVLEKMRLNNPTGQLADDVTMEIANTHFKREKWNDAVDTYQDLITTYPDSPHQFDAHFLGVKSALLSYQGPDYSEEPIGKAEKMLKQMIRQFPQKANEQEEQIQDLMKEVRYRQAEKLYTQAEWRYRKSEARAARMLCVDILKKYDDTPFAADAKTIMEKTGGLPPEPVQQMSWLADLFPSRDKITPLLKPNPTIEEPTWDFEQADKIERTADNATKQIAPAGSNATGSTTLSGTPPNSPGGTLRR